jgi:hypothetical protein
MLISNTYPGFLHLANFPYKFTNPSVYHYNILDNKFSPKMIGYWRIACWFSFLPFVSPANSSFTPLSQTSSHPFLGQHCSSSEKTALLQLKRDLSADKPESSIPFQPSSGSLLTSWKPNTDCCSWESVNCHEVTKHVIGLNLSGRNLSGLVNSIKFLNLPYLERLNLVNCNIGEIPSFVQKLGGLVE